MELGGDSRYFDIYLEQVSIVEQDGGPPLETRSHVPLARCNNSDWDDIGENFDKQFQVFGMDTMLCTSDAVTMIKGY